MPDERDRESLRDLDGVRLEIDELSLATPLKGISSDDLKRTVDLKLGQAGVAVLNQGAYPVGDPYLRVLVATTKDQMGLAAYHVEVDFVQIVFLRRNPSVTFNRAETWKARAATGLVPAARLAEEILRELSGQVEQFISAYNSVNR